MILLLLPPCGIDHIGRKIQPLGIAYIASNLNKHGIKCELIDGINQDEFKNEEAILNFIKDNEVDIVGFSVNTIAVESALSIAKKIKEYDVRVITIFGGHHSTFMHKSILLSNNTVDFIIRGEGEETFLSLINEIKGKKRYDLINGLSYRNSNGNIVINKQCNAISDLDTLPFPVRMDNRYYSKIWDMDSNKYLRNISLLSSRGCVNNCSFCSIPSFQKQMETNNLWRSRSPENIIEEINEIRNSSNEEICIRFIDDNFLVSINRAEEIAYSIYERFNQKIKFSFAARSDQVIKCGVERLKKINKYGCINIEIGIESGSNEFLKRNCKDTTVSNNIMALSILKEANITPSIDFLMFDHLSNISEIKENIDFINDNYIYGHYPPIIYNRIIPYPGTKFSMTNSLSKEDYFIESDSKYIFDNLNYFREYYQTQLDELINSINNESSIEMKILSKVAMNKPYDILFELFNDVECGVYRKIEDLDNVISTKKLLNTWNKMK